MVSDAARVHHSYSDLRQGVVFRSIFTGMFPTNNCAQFLFRQVIYSVSHNFQPPSCLLEIRVIIKILPILVTPQIVTSLNRDEAKKIKIADSIKLSFSTPLILNIFLQKFQGAQDKLMQRELMWHNLYGRWAVRRKLKKGVKAIVKSEIMSGKI